MASRWANRAKFAARARAAEPVESRIAGGSGAAALRYRPHEVITPGCPECAAVVETFTLTLSAAYRPPVDAERLFRRGSPTGLMRPRHND